MKKLIVKSLNLLKVLYYQLSKKGSKVYYRYKVRKNKLPNIKYLYQLTHNDKRMIKEYWKKYINIDIAFHRYYCALGGVSPRYIPDDLYVSIIDPYFNNREMHDGVCDKNYFDVWFSEAKRPITLLHVINGIFYDENYRIITEEDAINILYQEKEFVAKPCLGSCGGNNVQFYTVSNKENLSQVLRQAPSKNMVYQKIIKQCKVLNSIHPESVNTLRIMTLLFKGKVHVIQSVLRMGVGSAKVDNAMSGGVFCGIDEDGTLKEKLFTQQGKVFAKHPDGTNLKGIKIPGFNEAIRMVTNLAEKMGHFRMISWDVAIDENDEPVLIEANLQMGDIDIVQPANGPLFGNLTEEVLNEVFAKG